MGLESIPNGNAQRPPRVEPRLLLKRALRRVEAERAELNFCALLVLDFGLVVLIRFSPGTDLSAASR